MATDPFLYEHLTHKVDVRLITGRDGDGETTEEFYARVQCLVDEVTSRRLVISNQGNYVTYDFAVTLTTDVVPIIGTILEDARDEDGELIFTRGFVAQYKAYRKPNFGNVGYQVLVKKDDDSC